MKAVNKERQADTQQKTVLLNQAVKELNEETAKRKEEERNKDMEGEETVQTPKL